MPMSWEHHIRSEDEKAEMEQRGDEMLRAICEWDWGNYYEGDPNRTIQSIQRHLYKYTDCGAYGAPVYDKVGFRLGSIVEGCDEGADEIELVWPFTQTEWGDALAQIEREAEYIWKKTHGCPGCAQLQDLDYEEHIGRISVRPDCKECGGDGIPI